ncbi:inosine/uridine-preferring nucleoside hydrolase [Colletotrichum costaricense]|uniref:Inosine/uridine-preferring nucleoside hydrolase n=1 Tax=Colletotrichum costaricense TaxID=1209916 RepID=A0AAI9Z6H5_9PEZI|nr:inosine/uridine-preferring nucleoside hydrolase [Colletotrichum costaricense]KAK1536608.1 inosine/uridine-preferring nucleoside hydrolase [Colletotrichum costaricense]
MSRITACLLTVFFVFATISSAKKNLIVDTDLFSDCDDAAALLLAATSPEVNLLGVNINSQSSYSVLAASAILNHYDHADVPVGARRPLNDVPFFDNWAKRAGEFASKLATYWSKSISDAEEAWDPVDLYRKLLSEAEDDSVTIASIGFLHNLSGFLHNLSGFLNSTADARSPLSGPELVETKVKELVVMGGDYPNGFEFNFWGDDPYQTAHVIHNWTSPIVYAGFKLGGSVRSGGPLMADGPKTDPVRAAYILYTYYQPQWSFDPVAMLYAVGGLGEYFKFGNEYGYNTVTLYGEGKCNGCNVWVYDKNVTSQHWLKITVSPDKLGEELDRRYLQGARSSKRSSDPIGILPKFGDCRVEQAPKPPERVEL